MSRRHLAMLIGLAAIWGSSFMFIKVAVRDIAPSTALLGRVALGTLVLALLAPFWLSAHEVVSTVRRYAWPIAIVGIVNTALPVWLLFWAETRMDSGTAAVLQSTAPLFSAVFAYFFVHTERVSGQRLAGLIVGFGGVALLVGTLSGGSVIAGIAVVASALCYAGAGLYTGKRLAHVPVLIVALSTLAVATLALLPAGILQRPSDIPGWKSIAAVVVLGIVGTALAYLLYYGLVAGAGATRAILITYLVPPMALLYGVVLLGEQLTASAVGALALILLGVALGTGALVLGRRPVAPAGDPIK
jgi:drug/metabolite transporter (DMT)-like permease